VVRLMGVGPASESVFRVGKDGVTYGELVLAVFFCQCFDVLLRSRWTFALPALEATGLNANGQLGVGDEEDRSVPTRVLFQEGVEILLVSSGSDNSLALKRGGASAEPTYSPSAAAGTAVPTYAPTPGGTAAPTEDGLTFWFWGGPEAVGQESTVDVTAPIDVGGDVVHSSAGSKYSIIVLENGQALAAG